LELIIVEKISWKKELAIIILLELQMVELSKEVSYLQENSLVIDKTENNLLNSKRKP
jgi:hypothetical protein